MADRISISVDRGIADVRLNRPEKLNALDRPMFEAICEAIEHLRTLPHLACIVLSGEGRAFSVGIDLELLSDPKLQQDLPVRIYGPANSFQQTAWGWRTLEVPVIAAIHGFAFGGALQIALGADIRIAAPDAQLSMMEARWGLVPDVGGIALLRSIVPTHVARELTFTARRVSGVAAAAMGLVSRVADDPLADAMVLAAEIAGNPISAVRSCKRLFNLTDDADAAEILLAETQEQQVLLLSYEHRERIRARVAKGVAAGDARNGSTT